MSFESFFEKLNNTPERIEFAEVIKLIDENYEFTPSAFKNGDLNNQAGENNGSCKLFAFGLLHQLSAPQMLACFGHYYRDDVLQNPNNDDHQNIRNFIKTGWNGVEFAAQALVKNKRD